MTATPFTSLSTSTHTRAHGFDLLVMRLSIAALGWAERRADRATLSHEENSRRFRLQADLAERAHHHALRAARVL